MQQTVLNKRRKQLKETLRKEVIKRLEIAIKELYHLGAVKVYIFGSVINSELFDENSDVDIAVEGMPEEKKLEGYKLVEKSLNGFPFDLVFLDEELRPEIKTKILREGVLWKP